MDGFNLINSKLISVIIPCYNAERYVEQSLDSVLRQKNVITEIIVIDDGSSDNSISIIKSVMLRAPEKIILLQQSNKGPYPARNYGLHTASGEYVAFLDADDYWDDNFLWKMLSALIKSNSELAYCGWQNFGITATGTEPYIPKDFTEAYLPEVFLKGCPWPIHAAMVKRDLLEKINFFSEDYFTSMDYDLWLRLSVEIKSIVLVPEVLSFYRWHGKAQISSNKSRQALNALKIKEDFLETNPDIHQRIKKDDLTRLLYEPIRQVAFTCFWKSDFESSWYLFRCLLKSGFWSVSEMKYLVFSLLPRNYFLRLMMFLRKSN